MRIVCEECGVVVERDRFRKFCSVPCRTTYQAAHGTNVATVGLPGVRIPDRRRMDTELIGALFLSGWQGDPLLLADFAELIGETVEDLELRAGILAPWVEALISDRGLVLYGRHTATIAEVRAFMDREQAEEPRADVWLEGEAA